MSFTRSATGCLACKMKHKKCDETKPHCLRCQKARIECPGYTYVQEQNRPGKKLRTIAAPRTRGGQYRPARLDASEPDLLPPQDNDPVASTSYSAPGTHGGPFSESISVSHGWPSSSSFNEPIQHPSIDMNTHGLTVNAAHPYLVASPQNASALAPMTFGQANLFTAIFSLGSPQDLDPSPQPVQLSSAASVSSWSPPEPVIKLQDDVITHEDEDSEGAKIVIRPELVLDKTAETNAMPFVLQSYAIWIRRVAFEPQKLMHTSREFVCSHFGDGDQSRWIIGLLANVGSRIGNVDVMESKPARMISLLQDAVQHRLEVVKSRPKPRRVELVKALDCALETMVMHFHVSPVSEVMALIQAVTPIFRQLCPDPPGAPVNLPLLLQHPLGCLQRFAQLDISFSIVSDLPTMFQYEFAIARSLPFNPYSPVPATKNEGVLQWLHGIPNPILLLLARMKAMRQDGYVPDEVTVASLEQDIHDSQSFDSSCSEPFLGIMRLVVHECWRQAAYIYLYMAVCGDPSDTPRVKEAFKRYMGLINGTEPGRLPDEHLLPILPIASPH
ncbi:hypothetical protein B0J17DRAFT_41209 [Rhizoctonia solani]|nr:hypothetical protein B0J17DRAFT_41209 [Rhizoctonia solani]